MKRRTIIGGFVALMIFAGVAPSSHAADLTVVTEEWPPMSFMLNGKPAGVAVEVVEEILNRLKSPVQIQIVPWTVGYQLAQENPGVVLFSMISTEEREKKFKLFGRLATVRTNFYAKSDSNIAISRLSDAKNVGKIGVYKDTFEELFLKENGFANLDNSAVTPVEVAQKLMKGDVDLWAEINISVGNILEKAGYSRENVVELYTISEDDLYIAFSKSTPVETVLQWQNALIEMKKDGAFAKIYAKWLPNETPPN